MCGITGIINLNKKSVNRDLISYMNNIISYRGPDDEGYYFDDDCGLAFGHRRLSILDLSEAGHQPMTSDDKNLWITYNGEVYNYIEIREKLLARGYNFRSQTDTEVIIKAYQEWGENCVEKFNGMWAFAIWDRNKNKLFCSRDRFGIKPFCYFKSNNVFIFASEAKQILLHPEYNFNVNKSAVYEYISEEQPNVSDTLYDGIYQLPGANNLVLDLSEDNPQVNVYEYWDIDLKNIKKNRSNSEYAEGFYEEFKRSVKYRLRSDVPVAGCLSGGLDSSSIVCLATKFLKEIPDAPLMKTYSSCHKDRRHDETEFVKEVENHTNVDAHHIYTSPEEFIENIRKIIWHMDGPTINGSINNQYNIFKAAGQDNIKVILDGQGADEYLGGYHSFFPIYLASLLKSKNFITFLNELFFIKTDHKYSFRYLFKNSSKHINPECFNFLSSEVISSGKPRHRKQYSNIFRNALYKRTKFNGLPALLHYADRNSMAHSIESRVPFLDYKLVEYVYSLPDKQIINNGKTKYVLRNAMKNTLPSKITERKDKMGFQAPDDLWIYGLFKNHLLSMLDSDPARESGIFNIEVLKRKIEEKSINSSVLWRIFGTLIWYDVTKESTKKRFNYENTYNTR